MLSIKNPENSSYVDVLSPTIYQHSPQKKPRPGHLRDVLLIQFLYLHYIVKRILTTKKPTKFLIRGYLVNKNPQKKPTKKPRRGSIRRNLGIGRTWACDVCVISGFANMLVDRTISQTHTAILTVGCRFGSIRFSTFSIWEISFTTSQFETLSRLLLILRN